MNGWAEKPTVFDPCAYTGIVCSGGRMAIWLLVEEGPSLLELQFADYHPGFYLVKFSVTLTDGIHQPALSGSFDEFHHPPITCKITGSDRVEEEWKGDGLGCFMPKGSRIIRGVNMSETSPLGKFRFEGWYDWHGPRNGRLQVIDRQDCDTPEFWARRALHIRHDRAH
jgi:hypothetical protein